MDPIEAREFLAPYPEPIREASEHLRVIVRNAVPAALEAVRTGWRLIGYDLPAGRRSIYFAYIAPEPAHVHLGFEHGIFMNDPGRRLLGAHLRLRKVRFLTFRSPKDIDREAAESLVREAARVALLSRAERVALALEREDRREAE